MNYTEEQKRILGENIWIRRQISGVSKEDLAKVYGCCASLVSRWERGSSVPQPEKLRDIAMALNCSIHELHRPYRMPKLSFVETAKVIESKKEPVMSDEETIKAASEVFDNAYISNSTNKVQHTEQPIEQHPVTKRLNNYMQKNNIGDYRLSKLSGISSGTIYRMRNGLLKPNNKFYKDMEDFLNKIENSQSEEQQCKGSISDRFSSIYNTLHKALEDLDELKADIEKINKATALLKDI